MKTKSIVMFVTIMLVAMMVGCAPTFGPSSIGNLTESSAAEQIKKDVTTKAEIKKMFGSPFRAEFQNNGLLIWRYMYQQPLNRLAGKASVRELVLIFDENNVVKNYSLSEM